MTAAVAAVRVETALRQALGPQVASLLEEPTTTDIMLNESGRIFCDQLGRGRHDSGYTMTAADARTTLNLLAHLSGVPLTREQPILSAVLPGSGERVAGTIPPVTAAPTFAIRVPPKRVFDLDAFSGEVSESFSSETARRRIADAGTHMGTLLQAVEERKNILVCGSTGSGKTSLLSCLMQHDAVKSERVIVVEDTTEIQISSPDHVRLLTTPTVSLRDLVRLSLRMRPDRIILGELRSGDAALEMIHAANTGHGGSMTTIHANNCRDAIYRVEDLCSEVCTQTPYRAIRSAIDFVVFVRRSLRGRLIAEVIDDTAIKHVHVTDTTQIE